MSPVSTSSCLSCRVGITQHINHKDLLKVQNLGAYKFIHFFFSSLFFSLVFNQIRGFKTRHSGSAGVGIHSYPVTTSSSRSINDFDVDRSSTVSSKRAGREENISHHSNDSNQPPLSDVVNRASFVHLSSS